MRGVKIETKRFTIWAAVVIGAGAAVLTLSTAASAQSDEAAFYKGKSIELVVGSSAGGGYDLYARTLARFMGNHIPGAPAIVPKNMGNAGGLQATNYIAVQAPKDGTAFAGTPNTIPFQPLLDEASARYDATAFGYIGSSNSEVGLVFTWKTSASRTIEDAMARETVVSATGGGATSAFYSHALNATIGTRFKVISGYPGGAEALLAVERGEVEGYALVFWSTLKATKPDWLKNKDINLLVQLAVEPHPELKDVPLVTGYAKSEADRQALNFLFEPLLLGRPYFAPPGISPARLATLRAAFTATMKDAAFLAEAKARDMEIIVKDGTQTEKIVRDVYATPKDVIARVAAIRTEK